MTPWLDDGDIRLYHGDALETLRELPSESVDCVVTSPPYWGLRDYGTGEWDGGDPDCDHLDPDWQARVKHSPKQQTSLGSYDRQELQECRACGARRVDRQMGLEPTPDLFVAGMVELFREVRRVLAPHGTCWVNLGDSYAAGNSVPPGSTSTLGLGRGEGTMRSVRARQEAKHSTPTQRTPPDGLKPKDLVGIPWRVAFALQADGWWLRSDIIWAKPNPMPESVTDRPTKAHEYVFLLTKQPRYWFDAEAVREPHTTPSGMGWASNGKGSVYSTSDYRDQGISDRGTADFSRRGEGLQVLGGHPSGRNVRTVWNIATQPYPEAHFATYPEELARRCILAGCPTRVCRVCGKPSERIVERESRQDQEHWSGTGRGNGVVAGGGHEGRTGQWSATVTDLGWSDCGHNNWRPGQVLDPFIGSGTTAKVARDHQRHAIGIDLNREYLELAARRLQQLSLLT